MATLIKQRVGRAVSPAPLGPLTSPRLELRSYNLADAEAVFEAIDETRLSLTHWVPDIGCRRTALEVQTGLAYLINSAAQQRDSVVLGIWERSSKRFLGEVGLYSIDYDRGVGEVGYWLRQRAWGNGYIAEAVRTLASNARAKIGVSALEAHIALENLPSRRVVERLGFHVAGHRPPAPHFDGEVGDVLIYTLPASIASGI
jgi:ribosomal-protein-serine acetyltransferase